MSYKDKKNDIRNRERGIKLDTSVLCTKNKIVKRLNYQITGNPSEKLPIYELYEFSNSLKAKLKSQEGISYE
jgi:hypothetical protein